MLHFHHCKKRQEKEKKEKERKRKTKPQMLTNSYPRSVKRNRRWAGQVAGHMRQMLPQPPYLPPQAHAGLPLRRGSGARAAALGGRQGQGSAQRRLLHGPRQSGKQARAGCAPHGAQGQDRPAPAARLRATGGSPSAAGRADRGRARTNRHRSYRRACHHLRGRERAGRGSRGDPPCPSGPATSTGARRYALDSPGEPGS